LTIDENGLTDDTYQKRRHASQFAIQNDNERFGESPNQQTIGDGGKVYRNLLT
jgi:hypothetical protein